ncbi:hypothetical protein FACS1894170_06980 [Planctomycetales bacterium]|nr:hypothetical protein FACS1894170_06980 [Planctomycetales bacterium]
MQTFTDTKQTTWTVDVNVDVIRSVKQRLDVEMLDIETFLKRVQDPVALCDILYLACEEQADKDGIDSREFGRRLGGAALRQAKDALFDAYINFIPDPAAAEKVRVVKDKYNAVGNRVLKTLEAKMPKILANIDRETDKFVSELEKEIDRTTSGE